MTAVIINRPAEKFGYVIPLGTKSYPGPLVRRRVADSLPVDTIVYEPGVYETGVYVE